jgi:hypothetical protein
VQACRARAGAREGGGAVAASVQATVVVEEVLPPADPASSAGVAPRPGRSSARIERRQSRRKRGEGCARRGSVDEEKREKAVVCPGDARVGRPCCILQQALGLPLEPLAGSRVCKIQLQHWLQMMLELV